MINENELQEFYILLGAFFNNATVDQTYTLRSVKDKSNSIVFNYDRVIWKDFVTVTQRGKIALGKGRGAWDCEDALNKLQEKCNQFGVSYTFRQSNSVNYKGTLFIVFVIEDK